MDDKVYWSAKQVAEYFNIHINTLKRIPSDELPFTRIVGRGDRRYHINDIDKYIIMRTVRVCKKQSNADK
jgi:hypothetical protein